MDISVSSVILITLLCLPQEVLLVTFNDVSNKFREAKLTHDEKEHIRYHLKKEGIDPDLVNESELDFYYFKLHDNDQNHKLDGLEIFKAFMHSVEHQGPTGDELKRRGFTPEEESNLREAVKLSVIGSIDQILLEDDGDNDGYLDYAEYSKSRRTQSIMTYQDA